MFGINCQVGAGGMTNNFSGTTHPAEPADEPDHSIGECSDVQVQEVQLGTTAVSQDSRTVARSPPGGIQPPAATTSQVDRSRRTSRHESDRVANINPSKCHEFDTDELVSVVRSPESVRGATTD